MAAARRSSSVLSLAASVSGSIAAGRYSSSKRPSFRSPSAALRTGSASKCGSRCRRFSLRIRSSRALATARLGPTRIRIRPRWRTGGESDGVTVTTATGAPRSTRLPTVSVGGGTMFPSVLTSASCNSSRSVIASPAGSPASSAPTNTTPARRWSGRSLAKAHTASRIFPGASPCSEALRSTRSDSRSASIASSCSCEYGAVMACCFAAADGICRPHCTRRRSTGPFVTFRHASGPSPSRQVTGRMRRVPRRGRRRGCHGRAPRRRWRHGSRFADVALLALRENPGDRPAGLSFQACLVSRT